MAHGIKLEQSLERPTASDRSSSLMKDGEVPGRKSSAADTDVVVQSDPVVSTGAMTSVVQIEDSLDNFDKHSDVEKRKETMKEMLKAEGKQPSLANRVSTTVSGMFASANAMEKVPVTETAQVQTEAHHRLVDAPSHNEHKEKKSFLRKLGIGKDAPDGKDPHPELAENKGGVFQRIGCAARSKTGGVDAMERNVLSSQPTAVVVAEGKYMPARTEASESLLGRVYGAFASRVGPGNAMEHGELKPPPPTLPDDIESMSNVQKVSPFTGPKDKKTVGALDAIPAEKTSGVRASDVKAPGFVSRTIEEVSAVGEAVKEAVVGKKE